VVEIARDRLGLIMPAGDRLAGRDFVAIGGEEGPLIQREAGSMTRALFERAKGGPVGRALVVPSREALREAAAVGLGRGVLFEGEAGGDPRLAFVPFGPDAVSASICAVALREMRDVPVVAAFLKLANG
jgi:DNA-binding transcriptional LysR family regulator